ncbi:MAG: hypothetical protein JNK85_05480 [Verrucomicrobiales bacterium]|nr:hypothetical protein [Verrucomicrobiales bacterium]
MKAKALKIPSAAKAENLIKALKKFGDQEREIDELQKAAEAEERNVVENPDLLRGTSPNIVQSARDSLAAARLKLELIPRERKRIQQERETLLEKSRPEILAVCGELGNAIHQFHEDMVSKLTLALKPMFEGDGHAAIFARNVYFSSDVHHSVNSAGYAGHAELNSPAATLAANLIDSIEKLDSVLPAAEAAVPGSSDTVSKLAKE